MRITVAVLLAILLLGVVQLTGQRQFVEVTPQWDVELVLPREISPARYRQVTDAELRRMTDQGWEPIGVTPYTLLNEERGPEGRKQAVTQVYPAYMFRRMVQRPARRTSTP